MREIWKQNLAYAFVMLSQLIFLWAGPANARITVEPSELAASVDSNSNTGQFTVVSTANTIGKFSVSVNEVTVPNAAVKKSVATQNNAFASWFTFTPSVFTLTPLKKKLIVRYQIVPKGNVPSGIYRGQIQITNEGETDPAATANIVVNVGKYVAISPVTPIIDGERTAQGQPCVTAQFHIDTNVSTLRVFAEISPLKREKPNAKKQPETTIELDITKKIELLTVVGAQQKKMLVALTKSGSGNDTPWRSDVITVQGDDDDGVDGNIFVTVWWQSGDAWKPSGQYAGKIALIAQPIDD